MKKLKTIMFGSIQQKLFDLARIMLIPVIAAYSVMIVYRMKNLTGLVPIDDMTTMYTSGDAANFLDVFGENTDYVIDPEETLADNFAYLMIYGLDGREYKTPEIVQAIDALLKAGFAGEEAA